MHYITQILNWISESLLLPVIVLLLIAMGGALIALGGFASYSLAVLREKKRSKELLTRLAGGGEIGENDLCRFASYAAVLASYQWDELKCEKFISDLQSQHDRELERARFMTKVGPMLGLMGTLIPMGPALAGLASGDIGSMAYNMQIAFATTVAGCVVAGIGLLVYSVKKHYFNDEISDLVYLLELKKRELGHAKS